jgi:hypothetical protein
MHYMENAMLAKKVGLQLIENRHFKSTNTATKAFRPRGLNFVVAFFVPAHRPLEPVFVEPPPLKTTNQTIGVSE